MGPSLQALHQLLNEIRRLEVTSLHDESNTDGQENDLEQNVAGPLRQDPLTLCRAGESRAAYPSDRQTTRAEAASLLYYEQELTTREVGELMGVGESRLSHIHTFALRHLRAGM